MPRSETSPWQLGGLTWKQLGKRTWSETNSDDVFSRAAGLAFYFMLAIFPGLFFLVSLFGIVAQGNSELQNNLMRYISSVMPGDAAGLVSRTLQEIIQSSSGTKLWLGLLGALWSASAGISALMDMLNITYDVKEGRAFWKKRLLAIGLTIAVAVLTLGALVLILYGGRIAEGMFGTVGLGSVFAWVWKVAQWPAAISFVVLAYAIMYYAGPDVKQRKWYWITPGAVIGVSLWLLASFAFRLYLNFFNSYSQTYGALGGVIILMLWLYVTALAILIGSEANSEIEHAAAEHGEVEAKAPGQKVA
ncbi:MAG TPA: YihY/virulence factor BrkB family protein [Terriglobales bacterium]|nr:YihY/virulence factor BrkB family protein [Terriglobales bacterium]